MYRAINERRETLGFYPQRNNHAAYQFLKRCLRYYKKDRQPKILNTDKYISYTYVISYLKRKASCRKT
ncbi:MAG: DDE-type integrase/transposase/recombinase [Piscirickettsiaceae bacterium]|nr:DDE-type integrase/transposase/recombinase [Piscirickettsiaceae bacterium]